MQTRDRPFALLIVVGAVVLALFLVGRVVPPGEWLGWFRAASAGNPVLAPLLYVLVYALCCIAFVPATVLSLAAGAIFGIPLGLLVVVTGAVLGATGAFLMSRTIFRSRAERAISSRPRFSRIDAAVADRGARIVFLIRLSPIFPFTWVNYAFGLTRIALVPYVVATLFGILPGALAFVYLGSAAGGAATGEGTVRTILQVTGAIATLVVSIVLGRIAQKELAFDRPGPGSSAEQPQRGSDHGDHSGHQRRGASDGESRGGACRER